MMENSLKRRLFHPMDVEVINACYHYIHIYIYIMETQHVNLSVCVYINAATFQGAPQPLSPYEICRLGFHRQETASRSLQPSHGWLVISKNQPKLVNFDDGVFFQKKNQDVVETTVENTTKKMRVDCFSTSDI